MLGEVEGGRRREGAKGEGGDFLLGRALLDHDCGFCKYEVRDRSSNVCQGQKLTE